MWLYLANGILNVRGMIGHESHLELKKKISFGEIIGPRIFAAGPSLNGNTVDSPESGEKMVRDQKKAGYDHLKLHPGLDMPRFMAISSTAKEVGIKFGGHVSLDVGLVNSLNQGYRSVEHMDGYIEAMIEDKSRLDPQIAGPFSMLLVKEADLSKLPELLNLTLDRKAWLAPTLTLFERFFGYVPADEFRLEPEMKYMPGVQVQQWVNQKKLLENQGVLKEENVKPYLEFRKHLLKTLFEGGVPIILSSDSPQVFNVPGFSIHNEIKSMHEAGIPPFEILKAGSSNVAKYFEMEGQFGSIQKDASADFVLVSGNPLKDLSQLKNIEGIMLRGTWIGKEKLQEELKKVEMKNLRK
jgi:imidazolonepropionase-like amidohydrolase